MNRDRENLNVNHSGRVFLVKSSSFQVIGLNLLLGLFVSACTSTGNYERTERPATVEERVVVDGEVLPLPNEPNIQAESLPQEQSMSPVVQRLLVSAEQQRSIGDSESAANSLERALRIEPRNALLWSRLADVRFAQSDWQQAIQLAAKSNTLAGNDQRIRRQNWYMMVNAYDAMGDHIAAQKYRDKLNR